MELAGGAEEGVLPLLLDSGEDFALLAAVDLAGVSVFESDFESAAGSELDEDELSLELSLFSAGALGRP